MSKFATIIAFLIALLHPMISVSVFAGETCVQMQGIEVCIQSRGSCDLSRILPRESEGLSIEMLHVTVSNGSQKRVRVDPTNFMGVTETGQALKLDLPLFESIELRTKLRKADLAAGDQISGYLFFPAWEGHLRTIAHSGQPAFQLKLY